MRNDIFSKILRKELPSYKIYEDKDIYAFLDAFPATKGHTLVIPKKFYMNVLDSDDMINELIFSKAAKLSKYIVKSLSAKGVNILTNANKSAGQQVNYYHIHIIPRYIDRENFLLERELKDNELTEEFFLKTQKKIVSKIKNFINENSI